jgi:hypothetical protein
MITLQLNDDEAVLVEAAFILFKESLIGSKGALEAISTIPENTPETKKEIAEEITNANKAIEIFENLYQRFNIQNTDTEIGPNRFK